jgi:hypothetical protein
LDTYSSAPVEFAAYAVDPSDVLVAGSNTRPRAIDTHARRPVARWEFRPPGGYQFQSSEVNVPLGSREGFFVIEARRGNVGEQVWINRTRIGLLTKETPAGILLYGADLGTGRADARMEVSLLINGRFDQRRTDARGLLRWSGGSRPIFALARSGASIAFVSFLPQAPLPSTVVGLRVGSAVVHAGDDLRAVGYVRRRAGAILRAARGRVAIGLRLRGVAVATTDVELDAAGAFSATLHVPRNARAGEYAVLATSGAGTAGTSVHVDADAAGLALSLAAQCDGRCSSGADVPIVVRAARDGVPAAGVAVHVAVVRSPHAGNDAASAAPWGITTWLNATAYTGAQGTALVQIPHPTDGLASTYGVRAEAGGATAATRVVVPTAPIVLRLRLDRNEQSVGSPVAFDLFATDASTGEPVAGVRASVRLEHGASVQEQTLALDERGHARGSFSSPAVGSNLVVASAEAGGSVAMDAQAVAVVPQALDEAQQTNTGDVAIQLDRERYALGETVRANARLAGARGDALLTYESALGTQAAVVPAGEGRASAAFGAADAPGGLSLGAAFVRDGSLRWSTIPLALDAPGRPVLPVLQLDKSAYAPDATATADLSAMRPGEGTLVVRLTAGAPSGSALFDTAPDLLGVTTTTSQDTAPAEPAYHPWVDSTGKHAQIITFERRGTPPQDLTVADADARDVYWKVDRSAGDRIVIPVPAARGRYTLSILKIGDDGRVSAASADLVVQ